jgi:hypothetical protein
MRLPWSILLLLVVKPMMTMKPMKPMMTMKPMKPMMTIVIIQTLAILEKKQVQSEIGSKIDFFHLAKSKSYKKGVKTHIS